MSIPTTHHQHPYAHTLSLLRLAISKLPPTFPAENRKKYEEQLVAFEASPKTPYQSITDVIVRFGKDSWPWRKAYDELYANFGRSSEEAHLLSHLGDDLRQKYERFIHDGGKINHLESAKSEEELYQAAPFERYFTPEEKFAIQEALLEAKESARQEINELVSQSRAEDYGKAVDSWLHKQSDIARKIDELRKLADVSPKWSPQIRDRVRLIEEGWSVVEKGIDETALDKELEYWKGTLESFLHSEKI